MKKEKAQEEPRRDKVLTFMDMSHLSYFVGVDGNHYSKKAKKTFESSVTSPVKEQTTEEVVMELIEDILNLVFEGADTSKPGEGTIVDDDVLEANFDNLRKKVFVKERV